MPSFDLGIKFYEVGRIFRLSPYSWYGLTLYAQFHIWDKVSHLKLICRNKSLQNLSHIQFLPSFRNSCNSNPKVEIFTNFGKFSRLFVIVFGARFPWLHFCHTSRESFVTFIPRAFLILYGFYNHLLIIKKWENVEIGIRRFSDIPFQNGFEDRCYFEGELGLDCLKLIWKLNSGHPILNFRGRMLGCKFLLGCGLSTCDM